DIHLQKNFQVEGKSKFIGNITAPNIIYGVKAGQNVTISGDKQTPTIGVDLNLPVTVSSFQGQTGDIKLQPGTDISIDRLTISDTSTLTTVANRGPCSACLTDADVANNLTIDASGEIAGEAIKTGVIATGV